MDKAVALVSGGLDSVVSLALAREEYNIRLLIFCDYGQRARDCERTSAMEVASYYGIPFEIIDIGWLENLAPAGMQSSRERESGDLQTLDDVWIPNRNGVFLNVAAAYAESYGCKAVITGFNREEAVEFPDNSAEYVARVNEALSFSTRNGVVVRSFTLEHDKREIIALGFDAKAPLSVIWSCYRCGPTMCGRCASCVRLRTALAATPADRRPVIEFDPTAPALS